MADIPEMDEFAQTRGADDLFDDEIIPVSAEQQAQTDVVVQEAAPAPPKEPVVEKTPIEKTPAREDASQRSRGTERGRGRGRGRGGRGRGGRGGRVENAPRHKASATAAEPESERDPVTVAEAESAREETATPDKPQEGLKEQSSQSEEATTDAAANGAEAQRVPAVRGDRSATGGVRKPKLTEEELSKRIAAAKENAAKKAAAHARAEADEASFLEREQVAAEKRRQEQANRRVMDKEREQNRQRKLKAVGGREWDSQKQEEDYNPRGSGSQFRRGMHGGVSGYARRDFDTRSPDDLTGDSPSRRGRGRGGGRGGRGRGRSPSAGPSKKSPLPTAPSANNEAEFPALPVETKKLDTTSTTGSELPKLDKLDSLSPVRGSWADQVEE
ncbi:hypothetical protein N7510_006219 [Penicillium lagena]|uniref:uncharacterized protein n=1 Tax=Penicillium lagena TaxID=94218 RepID=UPI0025413CDF|nr:uncharacterized protein N7510_006219 [Penicillium lagena]KAJ5613025.1 hypothetical protein N7510_006219 [Penicillium lagena]